jgi:arylsulfatase
MERIDSMRISTQLSRRLGVLALALIAMAFVEARAAQPNTLVIWGDDIGQSNISAYTRGLMG